MENIIKKLRKEKGLTQFQLSKIFALDQTAISKWENGKAIPDIQMLIKLSDFFDVSVDYLLGRSSLYYPDRVKAIHNTLPADEQHLLEVYRKLNTYNRMKVTAQAEIRLEEQEDNAMPRRK